METTTIELLQTSGADDTLEAAKTKFSRERPDRIVMDARFDCAYPGTHGKGRYVGIVIRHVAT